MSELKICRICLQTEAKVYEFDQFQLQSYFEELMALTVSNEDLLPHYFCFECAAMLHKFHKFKEKCQKAQKILEDLLLQGPITYATVNNLDKTGLQSSVGMMMMLDRIKCYNYVDPNDLKLNMYDESERKPTERNKHIKLESESEKDPIAIKPEQAVKEVIIDDSVDSMDDRDDVGEITYELSSEDEDTDVKKETVKPKAKRQVKVKNEDGPKKRGRPRTKPRVERKKRVPKEKKEPKYRLLKNWGPDNEVMRYHSISAKRMRNLDPNNWRIRHLNEEEALKEFVAKASDPKYLIAPYKCTKCFLWFTKAEMLVRHAKLRHCETAGKHECRLCRCRYRLESGVREHTRRHYAKYECLKCQLVCELEKAAKVHDEYHKGVIKKCIRCSKVFMHTSTYYTHLRTAHRSEYICTKCGESFLSDKGIKVHQLMAHLTDDTETQENKEQESPYCERCDIKFETQKAYDAHILHSILHVEGVEKLDEPLPGSDVKKKKMLSQTTRRRRIPTDCYQCGKQFNSYIAYAKHHTADHPGTSLFSPNDRHICEICGASVTPGSWPVHLNRHTREKIFSCDICGKEFIVKFKLKEHLVETQENKEQESPYCERCDIKFETQKAYDAHILHSILHVEGVEKLDEPLPGSDVKKKKMLSQTTRRRRIPTDCYQCGKQFNSYIAYAKHHTADHPGTSLFSPNDRHICEICGASVTPGSWPVHLNRHTREKIFSCDICGKEFIVKFKLKEHLVVHTGERPFGCRLCDKRFKQRESLHVHYRTFHLKLPGRKRVRNT